MLFATDLDRTIIFSSKFKTDDKKLVCVETKDDKEISYMTETAYRMLYRLKHRENLLIVPVTTRSLEQYRRIRPLQNCPYAIVANGGIILKGGRVLPTWERMIRATKEEAKKDYPKIQSILDEMGGLLTREPTVVDDTFFFSKVEDNDVKKEEVTQILSEKLNGANWNFTIQGIKLYIIPKDISKEKALQFLKRYTGEFHIITAGDGKLDKGFLDLGEKRLIPEGSEILKYIDDPSQYIIVSSGVKATEDIFKIIA